MHWIIYRGDWMALFGCRELINQSYNGKCNGFGWLLWAMLPDDCMIVGAMFTDGGCLKWFEMLCTLLP